MRKNLQQQRTKLGNAILNHVLQPPTWHEPKTDHPLALSDDQIKKAIEAGKFHEAFVPLKIKRDYYRGIDTHYRTVRNQPVLIRDAREQKSDKPHNPCEASYFKYVQLGFNYLSGLIDLLEIENDRRHTFHSNENPDYIDIQEAKKDLIKFAQAYYEDIVPNDPDDPEQQEEAEFRADFKFGRFFHNVLVPFYRQYRPELSDTKLEKELQLARHFANMKVAPYAVATISRHDVVEDLQHRINGKPTLDVIELELPMTELTDEQKQLYLNRTKQDWYNDQSPTARALIDRYTPTLLNNEAMIPAQLIYHLIGTRNGYEKQTVVINNRTTEIINDAHHAGSQAHLLKLPESADKKREKTEKTENKKAAKSTINQLKTLTATDKLFINTLVTPLVVNTDAVVVKQIENAAKGTDAQVANTAQNAARRLVERNDAVFKQLVTIATELLTTLKADESNPKAQNLSRCCAALQEALQQDTGISDPDNNNLHIAALANLLVDALNKAQRTKHYVLVSGCLSGQDRGGMVSTHTTNEAICHYLIAEDTPEDIANQQRAIIQETQALAGHTQEMAGNAGTGFGGEGIKVGSKGVIPKYYPKKARDILVSKTGDYNEHIPQNPARPFYEKKSFWIGAALVVAGIGLAVTGILLLKGIILVSLGAILLKTMGGIGIGLGAASGTGAGVNYHYARKRRLAHHKYPETNPRLAKRHHNPNLSAFSIVEDPVYRHEFPKHLSHDPSRREFQQTNDSTSAHALQQNWGKKGMLENGSRQPQLSDSSDESSDESSYDRPQYVG